MTLPARNTLAIIGAGPVGLEAAAAGLEAGFDVHVFERGDVGAHALAWGHVQMFTPWRMNVGPASRARLERTGWGMPEGGAYPTGRELAERVLQPLAELPELRPRVHTHAQVVHASRRGVLKSYDAPDRGDRPFRLLVRDQGGRENFIHAFALIDASGVYGQPNWLGSGGIPARGELYLAPQLSYHLDDVLDLRRQRYAGKRTIVIGSGATAATVAIDLARLATEVAGTAVTWITRRDAGSLFHDTHDDPLPLRRELHAKARALIGGSHPAVRHVGGAVVEGVQFNSATHRYQAMLDRGGLPAIEEADQIIAAVGFGPDNSIYRELRVHECYGSRAPMKLAAALQESGSGDCLTTPAFGADVLANPEPNFYILGHKSYGRTSHFLLATGYQQVADVVARLASDLDVTVPA